MLPLTWERHRKKSLPGRGGAAFLRKPTFLLQKRGPPRQAVLTPLLVHAGAQVPGGPPTEQPGAAVRSLGLSSVDVGNLGDSVHKIEGVSLKRRRVSFGGQLRPELFDENLPPNTPLKRGETPARRRSVVAHTPAVLKKIIKEEPPGPGTEDPSATPLEVTARDVWTSSPACHPAKQSPVASDGRRRSSRPPAPSGGASPHPTDVAERPGRRGSATPSRRVSVGRSQHGTLQMIQSRRRSGASGANLMVAKSWADIVKLSAKRTQTKVAKHRPPRLPSRRQRKASTPKKPVASVHNEFSTGHAASPCTIVIGKAHLAKATAPARPCRMLNSFVLHRKIDFSEDLSGLPEMFQTPAKGTPEESGLHPAAFPGFGESVHPSAQNTTEEPPANSSVSPASGRQYITVHENMETPPPGARPPKVAPSAGRFRRSVELRTTQVPGTECDRGDTDGYGVENTLGRCLWKSPRQAQPIEGEMRESERSFETYKRKTESKENSEKVVAVRRSRKSSELKRMPRAELVASQRWQDTESKEDLEGVLSFFQTPGHSEEPVGTENKTPVAHCMFSGPVSTPTQMSTRRKTPSRSATVEDLPIVRKLMNASGDPLHSHEEPVRFEESRKAFKETEEQIVDSTGNVTGSRRRSRTPKRKVQPTEDLAGFQELFQTPNHTAEPTKDDQTTKVPCKSPKAGPVSTPHSTKKHFRTPLGKVDMQEALSALRKLAPTPGETAYPRREPEGEDKSIKAFTETPEQKLDPAGRVTGSRRRSRTPKRKVQPIEDLVGFRELFQTPVHRVETETDDRTTNAPHRSPKSEPVSSLATRKRCFGMPLGKADVREEPSALRKRTPTPGKTTCSPREPAGDEKSTEFFKETPKQKLSPVGNVVGSRRRSRTPKRTVQLIEDLVGFRELFQTPVHIVETVTGDKATRTPRKSPQPEPVSIPTSIRCFRTSLGKVDVGEELSPTPGETAHTHREPEGEDKNIKAFTETPKQKLDPAGHVTRSRKRSRTPKRKVQPVEDLVGFRELFQTPSHTAEPMAGDRTTHTACQSPQTDPASMPTWLETPLGKVDTEEEVSALRKSRQIPGKTVCSPREPVDDKNSEFLKKIPNQQLDPAAHIIRSGRGSRTPKRKVQPIEDLVGFQELFQTPVHVEPVTGDKAMRTPCSSPQTGPVSVPASTKRSFGTPPGKVDMQEEVTPTPGETAHSRREPEGEDKSSKAFMETPEQKLDPAEHVTRSRRRSRISEGKLQSTEDLLGFKELFHTPDHEGKLQSTEDLLGFKELFHTPDHSAGPMTDDRTTKIRCRSSQAEPVITHANTTTWLKAPLGKVHVEDKVSALGELTPTRGGTTGSPREPAGDGKGSPFSKESLGQRLGPAAHVTGSRRRSRTPKRKNEPVEDLVGFQELFQTPNHTLEPVTSDKTMRTPCSSPQAGPVSTPASTNRSFGAPPGKVDMQEEVTPTPGETAQSWREPEGEDKSIKAFMETPKQKGDLAEHEAGSRRRSRTPKRKNQPMEDLVGFQELFQTPEPVVGPVTDEKAIGIPCSSPQAKPVMPTGRNRRLQAPQGKVAREEALLAPLRKSTRTLGQTTRSHREPRGSDKDEKLFKENSEQKLDPKENVTDVTGSKRKLRLRKEKAQVLEDPASLKELVQTPEPVVGPVTDEKATRIPYSSPQAKPVMPTGRNRRLQAPQRKVAREEALLMPLRKSTRSHREPRGADKDDKLFKENSEQKLDPKENVTDVTGSKRKLRLRKEKAQVPEDPASRKEPVQAPKHTDEPVTVVKTTKMPSRSPQPEAVVLPASKRQLKVRPGTGDTEGEPSALRKSARTLGKTTGSPREPEGAAEDTTVCKEPPRQKPGPADSTVGSERQLRSRKGKAQPQGSPVRAEQLVQNPAQDDQVGTGAGNRPKREPDQSKPAKTSRRVLRAPKREPAEDLVGSSGDPGASPTAHGVPVLPPREREDGGVPGTRRLRARTRSPRPAEERPPQKRQRTGPRGSGTPPAPLVTKRGRRVLAESAEPAEGMPSKDTTTANEGGPAEAATSADQGKPPRSRLRNRTARAEQAAEMRSSPEEGTMKGTEKKPPTAAQEVEAQTPEHGAQDSTSAGQVAERKAGPRPRKGGKVPSASGAQGKARARGVAGRAETQEDRGGTPGPGLRCLRSRNVTVPPAGDALQRQPKQRAARAAKRPAGDTEKENDGAGIKRTRTRRRRDGEEV